MKTIWIILLATIISACSATSSDNIITENQEITPLPLQIIAPESQSEFVESDLNLIWQSDELASNQRYVLRLWFGEEAPQEIWTESNQINAQDMIDSYSQDVGSYYWQVAIVNTNEAGGFESMGSEWSPVQELHRVRRLSLTPRPVEQLSDTARFIHDQNLQSATEMINFTQKWMFENTLIGEELSGYAPDYSDAADMMFSHAQGDAEAPQMYCNGISTTMLTVLQELGIDSRIVYLYGETSGWVSEHTILEVFNPDTQVWQAQDPTWDLYYQDTETGKRASTERLVFGELDTLQGCIGDDCNADENIAFIIPKLGAFRYGFSFEVWVNPNRFDISRRVEAFDNTNFPEFIAMRSGTVSRNLTFRFDTWEN